MSSCHPIAGTCSLVGLSLALTTRTLQLRLFRGHAIRERYEDIIPIFNLVHHVTMRDVGIQIDAQTVLDYVHAHPILAKTPIVGHLPTACQDNR
jgi:hypothetical protein